MGKRNELSQPGRIDLQKRFARVQRKILGRNGIAVFLQVLAIFTPLSEMLHVSPVPLEDLAFITLVGLIAPIALVETHKFFDNLINKRFEK